MMILMVLVTTLVTPIWLKIVFRKDGGEGGPPAPEEALEPTGSA